MPKERQKRALNLQKLTRLEHKPEEYLSDLQEMIFTELGKSSKAKSSDAATRAHWQTLASRIESGLKGLK